MISSARSRSSALLAAAALALPLALAAAPPPAAAAVAAAGSAFAHDRFQVLDLPSFPAFLVSGGGRASYVSQSAEGTAVQEYGATGEPDAAALRAWAHDEPYGHGGRAPGIAGATTVSLGDLDEDGGVDAAYLIPGTSADGSTVVVLGSQQEGFPQLTRRTVPARDGRAPLRVDVFEAATDTSSTRTPANLLVTYPTGFAAYTFSGGGLSEVAGLASPTLPAGEVVLDAWHRPAWDRQAGEDDAGGGRSFAYVTKGADGVVLHAATFRRSPDYAVSDVRSTRVAAGADSARVRYDWDRPSAARSAGGLPQGSFAVTTRTGTANSITWARLGDWRPTTDRDVELRFEPLSHNSDSAVCAGDELATPDVEVYLSGRDDSVRMACATVRHQSGPDQVVQGLRLVDRHPVAIGASGSGGWVTETRTVDGLDVVTRPEPEVQLPGVALLASLPANNRQVSTSSGFSDLGGWTAGTPAMSIVLSAGLASALQPYYLVSSYPDPSRTVSYAVPVGPSTGSSPVVAAPLPALRNRVEIAVDDSSAPRLVQGDPVPVAFLAAPPQVAGSGQSASPPQFASTAASSTTDGKSTATRVGAMIGGEWEDPSGAFAFAVEASVEREVTEGHSATREISTAEEFLGLTTDDTVIYTTTSMEEFTGTIVSSSTGVAVGTKTVIDLPRGGTTSAASVTNLRSRFPAQFGPGGTLEPALQAVFSHDVGNPGSYLRYGTDGAQVDQYCDGSLSSTGPRELPGFDPHVPPNPFSTSTLPAPPQPDVLRSDTHKVLVGTGNAEGATFGISTGATSSRVENTSLDISVAAKIFYAKAGVSAGFSWGRDWSSTLSKGVEFASQVGHIPGDNDFLQDESYEWSSLLCQKTVRTPAGELHPWVLNYTVDGYHGSGGLAALSPVTVTTPKQSVDVGTLRPTLTWSQATGTVQRYQWELEAVGANDVQSGERTYPDPAAANRLRTVSNSVVPGRDLKPGQLYRWRVSSTDFFGNTTASDYEFFTTPAGPKTSFTASALAVDAGQEVTFTNTSTGGTSYTWSFGDATNPVTQATVTSTGHRFAKPGTYEVTLTGTNGYGTTSATRSVLVGATVADDAFTTAEDTPMAVPAQGVLANDNGATNPVVTSEPQHGLVTLRQDGSLSYTPTRDYCGPDTFGYSVQGATAPRSATVRLDITCVNDVPTATSDTLSTQEDTPVSLGAPGVLANDIDADGDRLTLTPGKINAPHGTAELASDGSVTYRPAADWCGTDAISYTLTDGQGGTTTGRVEVAVECVNDAPVARDDTASTAEGKAVSVSVLGNDTDAENSLLHVTDVSTPAHGALSAGVGSALQYTPDPRWCGTDTFTYGVADSAGKAATPGGTVTITVTCVNDAPVARDDSTQTQEDTPVDIAVTSNDVDPDAGDTLTVTVPAAPLSGTAVPSGDVVRYTPKQDSCGRQTFAYRVTDKAGLSATAHVTVDVVCVNDPPVARPDTGTAAEDVRTVLAVLGNDSDADGDPLTVTAATVAAHGTADPTGTGAAYTSAPDWCGADGFSYTVSDGHGSTASAAVAVTVTCVDDAPTAVGDAYTRRAGSRALVVAAPGVLANDTDSDTSKAKLQAVLWSAPTSGKLTLNATGGFTYDPTPSNQGGDSFWYRTYDGSTYSPPIRVVITVTQGNG